MSDRLLHLRDMYGGLWTPEQVTALRAAGIEVEPIVLELHTREGDALQELLRANDHEYSAAIDLVPDGPLKPGERRLISSPLSSYSLEKTEFLVPNLLQKGVIQVLAGIGGLGKSTFLVGVASLLSRGAVWPLTKASLPVTETVFVTMEEAGAVGRTLLPRAKASGAVLERIHVVEGVHVGRKGEGLEPADEGFLIATDVTLALKRHPAAGLIVIDPFTSCLGPADENSNQDIRALFSPIAKVIAEAGVTLVLVNHFNKKVTQGAVAEAWVRVQGSGASVNMSRATHILDIHPDDAKLPMEEQRRVVVIVKANEFPKRHGVAFKLVHPEGHDADLPPGVAFEPEPVELSANEVMSANVAARLEKASKYELCVEWLDDFIKPGTQATTKEVYAAGSAKGFRPAMLRDARVELGIESRSQKGRDTGNAWIREDEALRGEGPLRAPLDASISTSNEAQLGIPQGCAAGSGTGTLAKSEGADQETSCAPLAEEEV